MTAEPEMMKSAGHEPVSPLVGSDRAIQAVVMVYEGETVEDVARAIGVPDWQLRHILSFYGIEGRNAGHGARRLDVVVRKEGYDNLLKAAAVRRVKPRPLLEKLVRIVLEDPNLIVNLLDDGRAI